MANRQGRLTVKALDANGVEVSYPYYFIVADTGTLAQIVTQMEAFLTAIDSISDAAFPEAHVTIELPINTLTQLPTDGTTVSKNVSLGFIDVNGEFYTPIFPAPAPSIFTNGRVNLLDTGIVAIQDLYDGTTTTTPVTWTGEDFEAISLLKRGYKSIRKHRSAELRASLSQIVNVN